MPRGRGGRGGPAFWGNVMPYGRGCRFCWNFMPSGHRGVFWGMQCLSAEGLFFGRNAMSFGRRDVFWGERPARSLRKALDARPCDALQSQSAGDAKAVLVDSSLECQLSQRRQQE